MNLFKSERAASEVIDHALLLAITILGISMIMLYSIPALTGLQDLANMRNMEQAQTVLDSRASKGTLGDSPQQVTTVNLGAGTLSVIPNGTGANNKSYMVIGSNTFQFYIPMGKVQYQLQDRIVGYEDGGIWSRSGSNSVMLSPPELHYDGVTLTLPIFNISGNDSVGGKGTATILWKKKSTTILFPNTLCSNCSNNSNPVNFSKNEKVYLNVTSDFYKAWADFFSSSILYSQVSDVNDSTRTASIVLLVVPSNLGFEQALPFTTIDIKGLDPNENDPMITFRMKILSNKLKNLKWSLGAIEGNKELVYDFAGNNGGGVDLTVGYSDLALATSELWGGKTYPDLGGYVNVDLLDNTTIMKYGFGVPNQGIPQDKGAGNNCKPLQKFNLPVTNPAPSWVTPFNTSQSLYNITQHYITNFSKIAEGGVSFQLCGTGSNVPKDGSTLTLDYKNSGALTYLYISDNQAQATIT
jgi:hypothetical protein